MGAGRVAGLERHVGESDGIGLFPVALRGVGIALDLPGHMDAEILGPGVMAEVVGGGGPREGRGGELIGGGGGPGVAFVAVAAPLHQLFHQDAGEVGVAGLAGELEEEAMAGGMRDREGSVEPFAQAGDDAGAFGRGGAAAEFGDVGLAEKQAGMLAGAHGHMPLDRLKPWFFPGHGRGSRRRLGGPCRRGGTRPFRSAPGIGEHFARVHLPSEVSGARRRRLGLAGT